MLYQYENKNKKKLWRPAYSKNSKKTIALRHLINEDPDYLLRQYDQHTLLALEIDVAENIDERVAKEFGKAIKNRKSN